MDYSIEPPEAVPAAVALLTQTLHLSEDRDFARVIKEEMETRTDPANLAYGSSYLAWVLIGLYAECVGKDETEVLQTLGAQVARLIERGENPEA